MRVLVCGGRDYDDWAVLCHRLNKIMGVYRGTPPENQVVISGDACGADWLARTWAKYTFRRYEGYPADWKTHGRAAGAIRNALMLEDGKPDLVVAFPGGRGTADMVSRAKKAGVEVIEVSP